MIINSSYTKCPKCEAMYSYTDWVSENRPGAEFWSDGFCMAPERKDILSFAKCQSCDSFFWVGENSIQKPADLSGIKKIDNSWIIDNISSKEINFIKDAFRSGLGKTPEKEILLRTKLWHVINHLIRKHISLDVLKKLKQRLFESGDLKDSKKLYNASSSIKMNNLIRLANLLKLDKTENPDYILFAEIYRELGDFGKAMFFCHKAETTPQIDSNRIMLLKQHITGKSKMAYKL